MEQQFSDSEMANLRLELQESLLDNEHTAEILRMFLLGRGYGISYEAALEAAIDVRSEDFTLVVIRQKLEQYALVM
jgi:ATP-dependent helicase YprA (DUF1998 family)